MTKTIGIIGGGQLGQMMAISAQYMGHKVITLDPNPTCSAAKVSDAMIVADYDDVAALERLAQQADLLTYEFENVSAQALAAVQPIVAIPQGLKLLTITQNRRLEKEFLQSIDIPIAPYQNITSSSDLPTHVEKVQYLKTVMFGYDGHGEVVLHSDADLPAAMAMAQEINCVLEDQVSFDREISVIVAGNGQQYVTFPIAENEHRHSILHQTIAPARIDSTTAQTAKALALKIAHALQLAGTMCIEMFLRADGTIYVNELAPRPHNSGHYTIEACDFSQFDLHIKGILGEPLSEPLLLRPAIMINVLGQHQASMAELRLTQPSWHIHDYGKSEAKENRKMGHVTILTEEIATTLAIIKLSKIWD